MKAYSKASVVLGLLSAFTYVACSSDSATTGNHTNGGTAGSAGGGEPSSGGSKASGGSSQSSGGTKSSGGSAMAGGAGGEGAATSAGGNGETGGATGAGGEASGAGGMTSAAGGAGGEASGSGGTASGGTTATGGTSGAGGTGAGGSGGTGGLGGTGAGGFGGTGTGGTGTGGFGGTGTGGVAAGGFGGAGGLGGFGGQGGFGGAGPADLPKACPGTMTDYTLTEGTSANETFTSPPLTDSKDYVFARGGNDTIKSSLGDDCYNGANGNDRIEHGIDGDGTDYLLGGPDQDVFVLVGTSGLANIIDLHHDEGDQVVFAKAQFGLGSANAGAIPDANRAVSVVDLTGGANAGLCAAATPCIIYDTTDGEILYDADGSSSGAAIVVAVLKNFVDYTQDWSDFALE